MIMPTIRQLPDYLINQIAAGEVIENPAAAVKEMVENALDAGATSIAVDIRNGGKSYICVEDNGCGMDEASLRLCLSRHATSKLPEDDLVNIRTLGFRGEALPSIGSVARLSITSRPAGSQHALKISMEGGRIGDVTPASLTLGTRIEIRDLFYATPARLKFLRTDQAEFLAVKGVIQRLAMCYPKVDFSLKNEGRTSLNLPACTALDDPQLTRIAQIIGPDFENSAMKLNATRGDITLRGYAGLPTYSRGNSLQQYLFVGGRPVRDKLLLGALKGAYSDTLMGARHPVAALFIDLPPADVDVNVHPAKLEIRFRDPASMRGLLVGSIKQALQAHGTRSAISSAPFQAIAAPAPSLGANQHAASIPALSWPSHAPSNAHPSLAHPQTLNPNYGVSEPSFDNLSSWQPAARPLNFSPHAPHAPHALHAPHAPHAVQNNMQDNTPTSYAPNFAAPLPNTPHLPNPEPDAAPQRYPLGAAMAQLHATYIVSQTADGIILTDQHAAHERIVYERLKADMAQGGIPRQPLLVPEIINLNEDDILRLTTASQTLAEYGLIIESFGQGALAVREIPAPLANKLDAQALLQDMADKLADDATPDALAEALLALLARQACHWSIRAGRRLNIDEMNTLLRQMEQTPLSGQCNHGRPTYVTLSLHEIEKLFARR